MSNISDQLEEIKTLVSSGVKANKSFAYSSLLKFQEESNTNPAFMNVLLTSCRSLIPFIVCSMRDDDEEIAAKSLKCLGFMIYHPSIVSTMVAQEANLIIESLIELITKTQIKSVCNLGVWCISIQQFDCLFLAAHFHALLHAVVHALDNPFGSLSTTFESVQAIMKLAEQLGDNMKDVSSIWAPPIYRRLLSIDKRERNMSERCLLKTRLMILPPPSPLSKVIAKDMKKKLLSRMTELLNDGMELPTIRAWGWYIRILGSHSMKDKHLVNNMLKIPECTFSHSDPQVRIASQVAWEGLIDSLIQSVVPSSEKNAVEGKIHSQRKQTSEQYTHASQANGFFKSLRLMMAPLVGIMLSKCDISTQLSCLNTWFYLLHKLDTSINDIAVIKLAVEPILELILKLGHENKNAVLQDTCMNLFCEFILTKCRNLEIESNNLLVPRLSITASKGGCSRSSSYLWKQYPVKWLPWNLTHLDFLLKMISVIITPASSVTISYENKSHRHESGLKLFISVLKGVRMELKGSSSNYDDVMSCLTSLSRFLKKLYEDAIAEGCGRYPIEHLVLDFIKATTEELESEILGSPLYKVSLDLNYVATQSVKYTILAQILNIQSIAVLDMVSPVVYFVVLYFCMAAQSIMVVPPTNVLIQGIQNYFKLVYTSFKPLENMRATVSLLYKHIGISSLKLWTIIAKGLINCLRLPRGLSKLRMESPSSFFTVIGHLLCYPFIACSSEQLCESPQLNRELEDVIEAWEELYGTAMTFQSKSSISNILPEKFCSMIHAFLDVKVGKLDCVIKPELNCADLDVHLLPLLGKIVRCVLDHITTSGVNLAGNTDECHGDYKPSYRFDYILRLAVQFMQLSWIKLRKDSDVVTSVVFSSLAHFIKGLHLNEDKFAIIEMISCSLIPWFGANKDMLNESITNELQNLWAVIVSSLGRRCAPSTSHLNLLKLSTHVPGKTLHHPNPSISCPTITFRNCKHGKLPNPTRRPENLLDFLERTHLRVDEIESPPRHNVTSKSCSSSKRIQLSKSVEGSDIPPYSRLKRKRDDLTEHQKKVRRAQQRRERDCGRHGPGIRTYTCLDFSQGIEDSEEG